MEINGLRVIKVCRYCGFYLDTELKKCTSCKKDVTYPLLKKYSNIKFEKIVTMINDAFFRLESYSNGMKNEYQYFGFNDAFTKLFYETKKTENFTYNNCKLMGEYWKLANQIGFDYDKSNFDNPNAHENEDFSADCGELYSLSFNRVDEFVQFVTPDEIEEENRKFSITDIHKNTPNVNSRVRIKVNLQKKPKTFDNLFYIPEQTEQLLNILRELSPPVIDSSNNYIGKLKGVFPLWIKVLKSSSPPFIKHFSDKTYKDLLNQKIKGLNLSKDASEFRKHYRRLESNKVELDIKTILSQYSQSGKLGK